MLKVNQHKVERYEYKDQILVLVSFGIFCALLTLLIWTIDNNIDSFHLFIFWIYIFVLGSATALGWLNINKFSSKSVVELDQDEGLKVYTKRFWGPKKFKFRVPISSIVLFDTDFKDVIVIVKREPGFTDLIVNLFSSKSMREGVDFCIASNKLIGSS